MAKSKRFADGGIIPANTYPFANQNLPSPAPVTDNSVNVGAKPEPLDDVLDLTGGGPTPTFKKGGKVKCYAKGGSVRGGGCEQRGRTKGRMV